MEPLKNTMPMIALGTLFAILFGTLTGVISAWRRDTVVDKGGLWTSLAFYSMPTQWLGLLIVLFVAGAVGLPTSGIEDPTLGILGDASTWDVDRRPAPAHDPARPHARARPLRRLRADRALGHARDARARTTC